MLAAALGIALALVGMPQLAAAADPIASTGPDASGGPGSTTEPTATPTADPTATPTPDPTATPTPDPTPIPTATPPPVGAGAMNLFVAAQFRYQNPNYAACTATSVRSMLNFISVRGTGGEGFAWTPTVLGGMRDRILAWERSHDTMTAGSGTDPHGWRNALNYFGWGPGALLAGSRVYDDASFPTYAGAMKAAVRAMIATGKPVGMLGWRGHHAQMITGYYGLVGNPFARNAAGRYANTFSVAGFFVTDPLRESTAVNRTRSYTGLRTTMNYRVRYQRFYQTDSRLDDPYTPGYQASKNEWYGRYVLILPIR